MTTRRTFLATSALTAATHAFTAPKDNDIKIALIGCGGSGGNHILEQHCHNLDVVNWVMKGVMPIKAVGQGGRHVRRGKENGTIFDHHTVEFEDASGMRILSQCCQIGGKRLRNKEDPYQLEHDALFENVRTGKVRNDADYAAHSTMMGVMGRMASYTGQVITLGVMGRMASYTGQVITWEQAMNSQDALVPDNITWATEPPVKPDADGWYPVATPGTTLPV